MSSKSSKSKKISSDVNNFPIGYLHGQAMLARQQQTYSDRMAMEALTAQTVAEFADLRTKLIKQHGQAVANGLTEKAGQCDWAVERLDLGEEQVKRLSVLYLQGIDVQDPNVDKYKLELIDAKERTLNDINSRVPTRASSNLTQVNSYMNSQHHEQSKEYPQARTQPQTREYSSVTAAYEQHKPVADYGPAVVPNGDPYHYRRKYGNNSDDVGLVAAGAGPSSYSPSALPPPPAAPAAPVQHYVMVPPHVAQNMQSFQR